MVIQVGYRRISMSFRDRMEKFLQKGVETSKEVLEKAKEKTKGLLFF